MIFIYKNPKCRRVRGSHKLLVSCGYCKTDIAKYQKLGKGGLLRMYIDRITKSAVKLSQDLKCPNCHRTVGSKVILKKENKEFYKMDRSTYNTRRI